MNPLHAHTLLSVLVALIVAPLFPPSMSNHASTLSTTPMSAASPATSRITFLYDAFGKNSGMKKDWGFAALVEINRKRILFDTGDNPDYFAQNIKATGVDLTRLDFVIVSHRHGDHMGGLTYLLKVNPKVKIYAPKDGGGGVFGSSIPGTFFRKVDTLKPEMRYFDGNPPAVITLGNARPEANLELIDQTSEVAPGMTLIALVSDANGTEELK